MIRTALNPYQFPLKLSTPIEVVKNSLKIH